MKNREMFVSTESEQKSIEELLNWAHNTCDTVQSIDAENFIVRGVNYHFFYRGLNVIVEAQNTAAYRLLQMACNSEVNKRPRN